MTSEELKDAGYVPLTEPLQLPEDEDHFESILRQLSRGHHPIQFFVLRTGDMERTIWAKPVTQAYEDKL